MKDEIVDRGRRGFFNFPLKKGGLRGLFEQQ
jgi:hypothetical protein